MRNSSKGKLLSVWQGFCHSFESDENVTVAGSNLIPTENSNFLQVSKFIWFCYKKEKDFFQK